MAEATPDAGSTAPSAAATVREILEDARRAAGSGTRLAAQLEALGIGPPDTNRYSESAISNWIRGRTMPPADVFVAATQIAGRTTARGTAGAAAPDLGAASDHTVADLQYQLDGLRAVVIDLFGRLGFAAPNFDSEARESAPPDRARSAG